MSDYKLLNEINSPKELRALPANQLPALADEIRRFLVENVSESGGHLASNLGVVELTLALHRVFDTPHDRIIWDVGHQSYVHKILTGRKGDFSSLRTVGGLSGFTNRRESEYDSFGAGHSSTSISAALGFAEADKLAGRDNYTIAVIGDGAYTGGMVHEALNNCSSDLRLIIILNENEMSISKNTGRFAKHIAKIRSSKSYLNTKRRTIKAVGKIPLVGDMVHAALRDTKKALKNIIYETNYFEELGLYYLGPADGNDIELTERLIREAKAKGESVIIHLKTQKGRGYSPAEETPTKFHNIPRCGTVAGETFHSRFGSALVSEAEADPSICAITAAMGYGTGLSEFASKFPSRYFDVGIAEEHAVTFSAGLAAAGMKPCFAVYSTFLQRAYDNLIHDAALQGLPIKLFIDRSGLSPADGATHHGIFDVSFLSSIPNVNIYTPATYGSFRAIMKKVLASDTIDAVRYPACGEREEIVREFYPDGNYDGEIGIRANYCDPSEVDAVVITYGNIAAEAIKAKEALATVGFRCGIILIEAIRPYEACAEAILPLLSPDAPIVFLEEGIYDGGAGMVLRDRIEEIPGGCRLIAKAGYKILAIKNSFAAPESPCDLYEYCGISAGDIVRAIKELSQK